MIIRGDSTEYFSYKYVCYYTLSASSTEMVNTQHGSYFFSLVMSYEHNYSNPPSNMQGIDSLDAKASRSNNCYTAFRKRGDVRPMISVRRTNGTWNDSGGTLVRATFALPPAAATTPLL